MKNYTCKNLIFPHSLVRSYASFLLSLRTYHFTFIDIPLSDVSLRNFLVTVSHVHRHRGEKRWPKVPVGHFQAGWPPSGGLAGRLRTRIFDISDRWVTRLVRCVPATPFATPVPTRPTAWLIRDSRKRRVPRGILLLRFSSFAGVSIGLTSRREICATDPFLGYDEYGSANYRINFRSCVARLTLRQGDEQRESNVLTDNYAIIGSRLVDPQR